MANPEHLQILQQGVVAWNQWRDRHRDITPYLPEANLSGADLARAEDRRSVTAARCSARRCPY